MMVPYSFAGVIAGRCSVWSRLIQGRVDRCRGLRGVPVAVGLGATGLVALGSDN
jgi:hypothetical protein